MQFEAATPRTARSRMIHGSRQIKAECVGDVKSEHSLQMYNVPPIEDITISEFDEIAQERLKVLKKVEDLKERFTFGSTDYKTKMIEGLTSLLPIACGKCANADLAKWRRRDVIGHFILRLAFCRSPELTKWFVQQELDLFRFRFQNETTQSTQKFLNMHDLNLETVSPQERDNLVSELSAASGISESSVSSTDFWKIDFIHALDLVRRRKVFLHEGMAFVPFSDLSSIVCALLRANILAAMTRSFRNLALLEEEGRILPRLARLTNNAYSGKEYDGKEKGDGITRHEIDQLCNASFPPCMKQIHHRLRADHHMRHGARRQYGLFLKAIGLSLEEAIMFMREEFTKKIDSDKFEKQYTYNIRHMYGKEGRRSAYPAFPCSTIILSNPPAAGDCHGCPFKHTDHALLAQRLEKDGLNKEQVNTVMTSAKANAPDKACSRFFEYSHKMEEGALGQLITHPNQFYEMSREVLAGTRAKDNHLVPTQSTQPVTSQSPSRSDTQVVAADDDMDWDN